MKKIFNQIFIFIAAIFLFGAGTLQKITFEELFKEFDYEVSFYSLTESHEDYLSVVNTGNFYILTCGKLKEKETESVLDNMIGKSYKFENGRFDLEKFVLKHNFKIEITQDLKNIKVVYLHSSKLNGETIVNGKKINLQIAITKDFVVAGSPVILGTF